MGRSFTVQLELQIRPCTQRDLRALEWFGLFACHRAIIAEAYARHEAGDNLMLVADLGGYPVGQVWIDLAKRAPAGLLWALRVFPFLCRRGIGRRLVSAAEELLQERGVSAVEIGVEKENPDARRLYERLGYCVAGEAREEYEYVTPEGVRVRVVSDQWMLQKALRAS